ncbi:28S ribosomal protein S31, mitochondrial isoform X2 [Anopheles aquasalis]|uniref:28S ribosomal protein S31, mitochondrial isoform X2 n=1 Tax=Anopheles aquasalis TaxID=42839 RepID=UPI00215A72B3|nr:28S ribosomal protein S31, mitochondrial isoform X2 [Anopheles aquasalis]
MLHIVRGPVLRRLHKLPDVRAFLLSSSEFSSDSSAPPPGDGDDKPQKSQAAAARKKASTVEEESKKSSVALNRLNELLSMMNTESELKLVKKVDLPRPKGKKAKERKAAEEESDSDSDAEERPRDLAQATRNVANSLGGDAKKTESELLSKLLGSSAAGEGGDSLANIITGMAVDRDAQGKARDPTRSTLVKKSIDSKRSKQQQRAADDTQRSDFASKDRSDRKRANQKQKQLQQLQSTPGGPGSVKLFDGEPLGIFTDLASLKDVPDKLPTWQKLQERELKLSVTHPPANYFQKMALWTEQGKLWKFPIDNEQGRDEEQKVPFTEHVFLEEHLESWCPKRGPIRHFMELVCVGLSKNHYITAQEKRDHIDWYRDYFEQKKELLQEVIVQEADKAKEIEK